MNTPALIPDESMVELVGKTLRITARPESPPPLVQLGLVPPSAPPCPDTSV